MLGICRKIDMREVRIGVEGIGEVGRRGVDEAEYFSAELFDAEIGVA